VDDFGVDFEGGMLEALSHALPIQELIDLAVIPVGNIDHLGADLAFAHLGLPSDLAGADPFITDVANERFQDIPVAFVLPNPFSR
jgi:hypothetical protein